MNNATTTVTVGIETPDRRKDNETGALHLLWFGILVLLMISVLLGFLLYKANDANGVLRDRIYELQSVENQLAEAQERILMLEQELQASKLEIEAIKKKNWDKLEEIFSVYYGAIVFASIAIFSITALLISIARNIKKRLEIRLYERKIAYFDRLTKRDFLD